ncbi:TPA: EexN family lipoprotein [Salmonella enterica subsp. enterica serovar Wyldegreen]|nr:entry exclusion protein [Salmonella enterica]EAT7575716.1 entry exclusion protein [Salmonella enterica]EDW4632800.1 EexN family lipoprotein [Salmonella enterica subsp. enterica]HAK8439707.1 EexN family lipoprotein [Salmonella enterica]HBJ6904392.1 EexN family lipoprotein [Salmonella enterica subsp. enterica serovar Wyldegreen]
MKKTFVTSIIIGSIIIISGCEEKNTKEWYISHHEEMISKYTECLLKDHDNFLSIECQNARDALEQEKDKPDVKAGYKTAHDKLKEKIRSISVPDLNLGADKK